MRVSFCVYKTWEAVAGVATNTQALLLILLIEHYAQRRVKRLQSEAGKIVAQLLNPWFMANCWIGISSCAVRFSWIFTNFSVDVINLLGFRIVRFDLIVRDWPGR